MTCRPGPNRFTRKASRPTEVGEDTQDINLVRYVEVERPISDVVSPLLFSFGLMKVLFHMPSSEWLGPSAL